MEILFSKHKLGSEIVKAFSSIYGYTTKVITKTECFKEGVGILPQEVKIELTSLTIMQKTIKRCKLFLVIDNIKLSDKYNKIDIVTKYLYDDGFLSCNPLLVYKEGADFKTEIETILCQVIWSLNNTKSGTVIT